MHLKTIGIGLATALASVVATGIPLVIVDGPLPEPVQEPDYSKLAALPDIPELFTPLHEPSIRQLNQRQRRKLKRQQPHGK
jgi:hypothetical protein